MERHERRSVMVRPRGRVGARVEEIRRVGAKHVSVNDPPTPRNGHAELFFFVTLAVERNESQIIVAGKLQQRACRGHKRRRLIVVAIESADDPLEPRNHEGHAETRADGRFADTAGKVSGTNSGGKRQPGGYAECPRE